MDYCPNWSPIQSLTYASTYSRTHPNHSHASTQLPHITTQVRGVRVSVCEGWG